MPRILILDDRPINRQFLTTLLTYKGYETREASDGAEGLKIARTWRPDLAIVDIEMPGMNGIEFVRHVHADAQLASTPIIFYTASYEASEAARLARESGVDSVLMKPSEPAVILATIELALGRMGSRHPAALAEEAAAEFIRIHADAMRISALVEFQLEISAQRRPHEILSTLARASRNIVASEHSILTMFDGERIFGISNSKNNQSLLPDAAHGWTPHCRKHLQLLIEEGKALRTTDLAECAECLIGEIAARSYIGVPIRTIKKPYGWLCLVNRDDANEYSPEDERIVQTIAAQTAMAYENLLLYEEIRSEAELLDQNVNLLRTTIEASSDGILVIDRASRIVTYNQRLAELWRVPLDILRAADGRKCLEHSLALVKDPRGYQDAVDRAIQGEELTRTYELRDGRYVECHVAPRTLKGEIIGRVWNFRDVTASVRAEEALRASEEKYRSLISNIPDVTWTADAHAKVRFISANVVTLYGYSPEEIYLNPETFWLNRIHPEDVDRVTAHYTALFETGQPYDVEFRLQRKDGKWIWAHGWSVGTYERDVVVYADGVVRDITARKEAEAEFRRVAADRELLLESTADGIYAVDNKGRCTMANRVAAMLLGRTLDELIGKRVHDLMHHHKTDGSRYPVEECAIYLAFKEGKASRIRDEVFWRKDGTSFPVEYVSSPLVDRGVVRGAVVTFADVTERQKLEQRLQQISRVSSLGRMAATIAHEFNNVLMGIQPFAETIRRRAAGDPKLQQAASQILNSVSRGKGVTQDILRMTRTQQPVLESVDMTVWLGQVAEEIRPQMNGRISVDIQAPPPATLFARCDPNQMQQVLTNLALNARDAMPGGGKLTLSLHDGETVRVVLADTGCGIPAETLPFIFEPLFTTKRSGTGLGLAVVQQLVLSNGGTIGVESVVDQGTQFDIELPRAAPVVPRAPDAQPLSPRHFGVRRVLVVEDDPDVASGLASILEAEGVETSLVTNGSEAMKRAAEFQPDAMLIDIGLPDMSGIEVYEQVAARWPKLPVIFSTGHADENHIPHPQQHIGFLRKPYSTETLLAKLREVVL